MPDASIMLRAYQELVQYMLCRVLYKAGYKINTLIIKREDA